MNHHSFGAAIERQGVARPDTLEELRHPNEDRPLRILPADAAQGGADAPTPNGHEARGGRNSSSTLGSPGPAGFSDPERRAFVLWAGVSLRPPIPQARGDGEGLTHAANSDDSRP